MEDFEFEFDTIVMTMEDGTDQEFAILDEFEFEDKKYMVVSMIVDGEIEEDMYIYGYTEDGDDEITIDYIEDDDEYDRVAEAYDALIEAEFEEDEEEEDEE